MLKSSYPENIFVKGFRSRNTNAKNKDTTKLPIKEIAKSEIIFLSENVIERIKREIQIKHNIVLNKIHFVKFSILLIITLGEFSSH